MSFDVKCYDLAQDWLRGESRQSTPTDEDLGSLAQTIQDAIENWLKEREAEKEQPLGCCGLCGKQLPRGEEMFRFHGYSGPCPQEK